MRLPRRIWVCAIFVALALTACVHRVPPQPTALDADLFPLVVEQLLREATRPELRIDPRPLKPDPGLVTLDSMVQEVAPTQVGAPGGPLLTLDGEVGARRKKVLSSLRIPITDALLDDRCPGALVAPLPESDAAKRERCPAMDYRSVMIAVPRAGGVYWPGNFDERANDKGEVWSVRVIRQDVGPAGKVAAASDYVFVREAGWRFVKKELLFILE
jgi:hypothetical protein